MPDFVYDIPQADLAFWFAVLAVGGTFLGLLFLKPLLRLLVGAGPDLNQTDRSQDHEPMGHKAAQR